MAKVIHFNLPNDDKRIINFSKVINDKIIS